MPVDKLRLLFDVCAGRECRRRAPPLPSGYGNRNCRDTGPTTPCRSRPHSWLAWSTDRSVSTHLCVIGRRTRGEFGNWARRAGPGNDAVVNPHHVLYSVHLSHSHGVQVDVAHRLCHQVRVLDVDAVKDACRDADALSACIHLSHDLEVSNNDAVHFILSVVYLDDDTCAVSDRDRVCERDGVHVADRDGDADAVDHGNWHTVGQRDALHHADGV